jgi:hypothetical protein
MVSIPTHSAVGGKIQSMLRARKRFGRGGGVLRNCEILNGDAGFCGETGKALFKLRD